MVSLQQPIKRFSIRPRVSRAQNLTDSTLLLRVSNPGRFHRAVTFWWRIVVAPQPLEGMSMDVCGQCPFLLSYKHWLVALLGARPGNIFIDTSRFSQNPEFLRSFTLSLPGVGH